MRKVMMTLALAIIVFSSSIMPALAMQNSTDTKPVKKILNNPNSIESIYGADNVRVVAKSDGYVVKTVKDNVKPKSFNIVSPMAVTSKHIDQNGSGTFNGTTSKSYGGGTLMNSSVFAVYSDHNTWPDDDYLEVGGDQQVFYAGGSNATQINMVPHQIATASSAVFTVGLPVSVSVSTSGNTVTTTWPQVTIPNNYIAEYDWDWYNFETGGHFTDAKANDYVTWVFGTTAIGQQNTIDVTIG